MALMIVLKMSICRIRSLHLTTNSKHHHVSSIQKWGRFAADKVKFSLGLFLQSL